MPAGMRDFPSCFGENGVQVADSFSSTTLGSSSRGSKAGKNTVTCIYQTHLAGGACTVAITWSKSLLGQGFSIAVDDMSDGKSLCKFDIKPWLFSKRKGSKTIDILHHHRHHTTKVDIFWNLASAKFGYGPEPSEGFYVAITTNLHMVLLIGDMKMEAYRKTNLTLPPPTSSFAKLISKREHISGKKMYSTISTRTQFCNDGRIHDITINCESIGPKNVNPQFEIHIDRKSVMQVKNLSWKFRGNQTIHVDGNPVEVFWDVHSWLFGSPMSCSAVFMFQTCSTSEKMSSWSCSEVFWKAQSAGLGFSLVLYAWRSNE